MSKVISLLVRNLYFFWLAIVTLLLFSCKHKNESLRDEPVRIKAAIDSVNFQLIKDPQQRMNKLDSLKDQFTDLGPGDKWTFLSIKSNWYIFNFNNLVDGKKIIDSMYAIVKGREEEYPQNYAWTLYNHAALLLKERRNDEAFELLYDGAEFAKSRLDSCDVGSFYDAMTRIKMKQDKYEQALPYSKLTVIYTSTCKPSSENKGRMPTVQSTVSDVGKIFERLGKLDSAIIYYKKALEMLPSLAIDYGMRKEMEDYYQGKFLGNLGGAYALIGNESQAEENLKKAIKLASDPKCGCSMSISSENKLLELYLKTNRTAEANALFGKIVLDISKNASLKDNLNDWVEFNDLRWQLLAKKGQMVQSFDALRFYYKLRDSVADVNKGLFSMDLESRFKTKQQQQQLDLLEKDNKIKKLYLLALGIFVFKTVIIVWLVIASLRKSKRQVTELKALNITVKEQNEHLQYSLQGLEQSQRENTEMLLLVAHDLRNPIGAMTLLSQLLLRTERSEEDTKMLNLIEEAGDRSLNLVNSLLETNSQKDNLNKEQVDMFALLKYCVGILQVKAIEKQQHISMNARKGVIILADREKLWRVVSNIIANAIKFSHNKSTITVKLVEYVNHVCIEVADQGIGIPLELQSKIFDIAHETKRKGTAGEATFGLGLAICKQIVEAHDGKIWFESQPQVGTTFYVKLPIN